MNIKLVGTTLKVTSAISKAAYDKGYVNTSVTDDKGNEVYRMCVSSDGTGKIGKYGIVFNSVDAAGNFETVIQLPIGTTKEDAARQYGDALIAAQANLDVIAAKANEREAVLSSLFDAE